MAAMDVFKGDAFSMMSLIAAIENADYRPQYLGSLGIFTPKPQRTRVVAVEERDGTLELIQTSPIGAPLAQRSRDERRVRNFNTTRLAKHSRIMADELQDIRAFGSETELAQVQEEVATRLQRLKDDMELTWERHRLGAVQGIVLDADNTPIVNYYDAFGVAQPGEEEFDFDGDVRAQIQALIVRPMLKAAKGAMVTGSRIVALCGDDFFDALTNAAEVRQTYLNFQAAAELREGNAYATFRYGGVEWVNYRGTDDGSTVAIATDKAKFFPVGARDVFQVAWAPAEFMDVVNMPGRDITPLTLIDPSGRNAFADVEVYSYPLFLCTRPLTLLRATLST
jgi:hypothetical protein